ncbi:uncharacterized protein EI90DRAFT_3065586 [Cantharellus anzutake]|uniref:uncharacterized protein n=1 Tax=Cantharellus anzutake TaxID=1750568 RepID=UPI00190632D8|nr:uncharacterized protein EI90DRAFT_3065586 [Cantharellus anzutake]KAF8328099.1 hypothetical protein EI90DRAFT_3065586 [Cantharellus anzutake]
MIAAVPIFDETVYRRIEWIVEDSGTLHEWRESKVLGNRNLQDSILGELGGMDTVVH